MSELQILSADGKSRVVPLTGPRVTLGRSSVAELCYPDDAGLSRQHLSFEIEGAGWYLRDLGSKNGTILNGVRIDGRHALKPGDRVMAGHLVLIYDARKRVDEATRVVFVESSDPGTSSSTVISDLAGIIQGESVKTADTVMGSTAVQALIRAGNELAGERPLPELFRFILDLGIQAVNAERGILMTLEDDGELLVRATRGEGFRISSAVRDRVIRNKESVLVRDTALDDAFRERRSIVEQNIRTLMAAPLQTRERIIGLIYVDSPSTLREFSKDDLSLLTVMANVAAIRIEQSRFAEMDRARKVMESELTQAAEIQRRYLPPNAPSVPGLDLAGHNAPCRTVGGDYYHFFPYPNGRVAMVLGDVSGKGMPASLLMMGLQARVEMLIDEPEDLARVMTRLNRITQANCPDGRFITLFLCVLDATTGELVYANAGHNPPVIVRGDGSYDKLPGGGPVLGILPNIEYAQYSAHLEKGDVLAIYSDGITEATTPDDVEFEAEHLAATLHAHRAKPAETIVREVNAAVAEWTQGAPAADDITLIVARRLE
ncbi:MAG: serine phosphatase [Bryobacterales bacterium]|nr:serine phosphatase [Bryobacterales bacterium]